jgi:hypothetical protein
VLEGAINGPMFLAYVKQCLVPTLKPGEIVLMDARSDRNWLEKHQRAGPMMGSSSRRKPGPTSNGSNNRWQLTRSVPRSPARGGESQRNLVNYHTPRRHAPDVVARSASKQ